MKMGRFTVIGISMISKSFTEFHWHKISMSNYAQRKTVAALPFACTLLWKQFSICLNAMKDFYGTNN